jgi:hypothetical protein
MATHVLTAPVLLPAAPTARAIEAGEGTTTSILGWILFAIRESVALVAIVLALPLAILCIGIPIAAAIRLVLWIVHLL